jgi:hypothetical protein
MRTFGIPGYWSPVRSQRTLPDSAEPGFRRYVRPFASGGVAFDLGFVKNIHGEEVSGTRFFSVIPTHPSRSVWGRMPDPAQPTEGRVSGRFWAPFP